MSRLRPEKINVIYARGVSETEPVTPRRYTLTHSDTTGNYTLTVGSDYDHKQISGWYTRFMRDEVLAEWNKRDEFCSLDVYCHVCGGLIFGGRSLRERIFLSMMPLVFEAFKLGDKYLFERHTELDNAVIRVHLQRSGSDYRVLEMGFPPDSALEK